MKKIIVIIAILFYPTLSFSQTDNTPLVAYKATTGNWNKVNDKWDLDKNLLDVNIFIFLLKDRIKVKDKNNSIYYVRKTIDDQNTKEHFLHIWECFDEKGNDCKVGVCIDNSTNIMSLQVIYVDNIYVYYVRPME